MTWSITDQVRRRGRPREPRPDLAPARVSNATAPKPADGNLDALTHAARDTAPACAADTRYTADRHQLTPEDLVDMRGTCNRCPLRELCHAYANTARPAAGFWAGTHYEKRTSR